MKLKKRLLSTLLVAMTFLTLCQSAFAAGSAGAAPPIAPVPVEQEFQSPYVVLRGTILKVTISGGVTQVRVRSLDNKNIVVLNITETTKIVDSVKRTAVAPKNLKTGTTVIAWHSPAMTRSNPPITNAEALIVNVPKQGASGQFIEVETVTKNKDGSISVLNAEQDLYFTIPKTAKIKLFNSNKTVSLSSIKPGSKLVVWYEVAALSYPAQAGSDQVIAFADEYDGYIFVKGTSISVNGSTVAPAAILKGSEVWLPAQAVAEKLGFTVSCGAGAKTLTIKKGGETVAVLTAGKDTFKLRGEQAYTSAPFVRGGRLYVQLALFSQLGDYKLAHPIR